MKTLNICDDVLTQYGQGTIVDIINNKKDEFRYGLKLKNNPFDFPIVYFFPCELSKIIKD